ncbi:MAG: VWA domain-containing protein [Brumimicrobium sp.]|nr:VWA domain-containing protein [Brumimicrobium sp.]
MKEFFTDIPLWTLLIWGPLALFLSMFYYRKNGWLKEVAERLRWTLIALRFLGLLILGILILGILLRSVSREEDKPTVIAVVDHSASMLNYPDSNNVDALTKNLLNGLKDNFGEKFETLIYDLDGEIENTDSLRFISEKTDLYKSLDDIYNNYYGRNIGAVILLSDGNYNRGLHPRFAAEKLKNVPIYTLGVGDTIQKIDHLISNITSNDIAFLNNQFPIEVTVEGYLCAGKPLKVSILENNKVIESKELVHQNDDYSIVKTRFLVNANSLGVHQYTVQINEYDDEFNRENNSKSVYVEVLDDRSKVLLVAEGLHPDIGAIRIALDKEQNIDLNPILIKDLPKDLKKYDLIIWHQPGLSGLSEKFEQLRNSGKAVWYFLGSSIKQSDLNRLEIASGARVSGKTDNVRTEINSNFNLFQLSEKTLSSLENFPPLNIPYGKFKTNNPSSVLAYQKVGSVVKEDPLYYFGKNQNLKYAVTYGTGIWSWKLSDYQENSNNLAFNEVVSKTVQYLILKENTSRLRIKFPSLFTTDENIRISATFYNASYEPITEPSISFVLSNEGGEEVNYSFLPSDNAYFLDLGSLKAGKYSWKASCTYNGETFNKSGSFVVRKLELEAMNTRADHQLLNQLATNNMGSFYLLENYERLLQDLGNREDITAVSYETSSYKNLIDYFFWFILVVCLFTAEWFIRRYKGSY